MKNLLLLILCICTGCLAPKGTCPVPGCKEQHLQGYNDDLSSLATKVVEGEKNFHGVTYASWKKNLIAVHGHGDHEGHLKWHLFQAKKRLGDGAVPPRQPGWNDPDIK